MENKTMMRFSLQIAWANYLLKIKKIDAVEHHKIIEKLKKDYLKKR